MSVDWRKAKQDAFDEIAHLHDIMEVDGGHTRKFYDDVKAIKDKFYKENAAAMQEESLRNNPPDPSIQEEMEIVVKS